MKFIFETEDEEEALIYSNAPQFYAALHEIRQLLRNQHKCGYTLSEDKTHTYVVANLMERVIKIIDKHAPLFL